MNINNVAFFVFGGFCSDECEDDTDVTVRAVRFHQAKLLSAESQSSAASTHESVFFKCSSVETKGKNRIKYLLYY